MLSSKSHSKGAWHPLLFKQGSDSEVHGNNYSSKQNLPEDFLEARLVCAQHSVQSRVLARSTRGLQVSPSSLRDVCAKHPQDAFRCLA